MEVLDITDEKTIEELKNSFEILDTTDENTINEFKKNLASLIQEAKQKGKIDRFAIIREDNYLPKNWQWQSNSMYTQMEYSYCFLTSTIINEICLEIIRKKREEKRKITSSDKKSFFSFFSKRKKESKELSPIEIPISPTKEEWYSVINEIDKSMGKVYTSTRYRLSKHYTINTPLSHTGEYNSIEINRNFIFIDDAKKFFESPYVFTAAYRDGYLDTTHEPLEVSENAIVLIPIEKLENILKDPKIAQLLTERKTIIFKGDEGLAVNIVLAKEGYLPARFGYQYADYDPALKTIMDTSLEQKCKEKNIPYNISHTDHFSLRLSEENTEFLIQNKELYEYLINKFPDHGDNIPDNPLDVNQLSERYAKNLIKEVGVKSLIEALQEYNQIQRQKFEERNKKYLLQQKNLTTTELEYFRKVALLIKQNLAMVKDGKKNIDPVLYEYLGYFYEMGNFENQFIAAQKLKEMLENSSNRKV